MNNTTNNSNSNSNQAPQEPAAPAPATGAKESEQESSSPVSSSSAKIFSEKAADVAVGEEDVAMTEKDSVAAGGNSTDDPMDEDASTPATIFCIKLKQPKTNLLHKMSVPELCRTFRCVLLINFRSCCNDRSGIMG